MIDPTRLGRLQKADPDTWQRLTCFVMYEDEEIENTIDIISYGDGPGFDAILQHVLQDACRAKGYSYKMKYLATIPETIAEIDSKNDHYEATGNDEPDALLKAYLAAIEAEACK